MHLQDFECMSLCMAQQTCSRIRDHPHRRSAESQTSTGNTTRGTAFQQARANLGHAAALQSSSATPSAQLPPREPAMPASSLPPHSGSLLKQDSASSMPYQTQAAADRECTQQSRPHGGGPPLNEQLDLGAGCRIACSCMANQMQTTEEKHLQSLYCTMSS